MPRSTLTPPTVTRKQIRTMEYVPCAPLRKLVERALADGTIASYAALSEDIGLAGQKDNQRIKRLLGIKAYESGRVAEYIRYDVAVRIVEYCGAFPVDYGV